MNLPQKYILDWQGEVGRTEPLHTLLRQQIRDRELGQNTYFELTRDEEESEELDAIFKALDQVIDERPDKVIVLCWY